MEILRKQPITAEDGTKGSVLVLKCDHVFKVDHSYQPWEIECPYCEPRRKSSQSHK